MYSEPHGALLPFGGHKGYALAVVTELLAGALSGGATIQPGNERRGGTVNNMFTMLIDPARMAGLDWFRREIDGFVDYVKASPPADGAAPVLDPRRPGAPRPRGAQRTGIAVDATTWEDVLQAGEKVGLARSAAARPDQTLHLVVAETGHAPDELRGGGEARRAVGQRGRHVVGVGGQDALRAIVLPDDARIHEAA